jgi:hypothetical protein
MRVLIGIDGTAGCLAAVEFAGQLLSSAKDSAIFYYLPPPVWVRAVADASGTAGEIQVYPARAVYTKAREYLPQPLRESLRQSKRKGLVIVERRSSGTASCRQFLGPRFAGGCRPRWRPEFCRRSTQLDWKYVRIRAEPRAMLCADCPWAIAAVTVAKGRDDAPIRCHDE